MAAPLTCDELLDSVRESGILEEETLGTFLAQWDRNQTNGKDAQNLAEGMLKNGLITRFQKDMLLQGKRRGYIIADKYILLDHLGAGGMGSVYLCQHKIMQRRVAIKVLPTAFAKDPEYLQRFHREARAAAALDHPNIVRAFDVDHDEKIHFLVMEYVDGSSLQDMVNKEGPLDIRKATDFMAQAASGLQHAHEAGLVHRDIKPGNLLVDRKGTVKVLDMGLALFFQEQGKSLTQQYDANAVLGTAEYLAPEQAVDSHGVDIRADIYSLGLTFYYLLTAKSPYGDEGTLAQKLLWHQMRSAKSVREFRSEVPEGLAAIISKMLAKNREERYQTPAEVVEALTPWIKGTPDVSHSTPAPRTMLGAGVSPVTQKRTTQPSDTLADSDTKGSGVRTRKKTTVDSGSPVRTRRKDDSEVKRKRPSREDIFDGDDDERERGPRSSGKHRRAKPSKGVRQDILIASIGSVLLVAVVIGIVLFIRNSSTTPPQNNDNVAQLIPQLPQIKPDETTPPKENPPVDEKKDGPKDVKSPPVIDTPPKPDPQEKIEPKTPKVDPSKDKPPAKKETPPKKEPPKKEPPKTQVKKAEALEDFFPKAGATLFYDVADFTGTGLPLVHREKWEFKDKGQIEATFVKLGLLEGPSLFKGGVIKWTGPYAGKGVQIHVRKSDTHLELGQVAPKQSKPSLWDPVLPLSATDKDTWKWQLPTGDIKKYSIVKFEQHKSGPAVVIRSTLPATAPFVGDMVTQQTYVKGLGEVSSVQTLEKGNAKPKLLAEKKLVDE